jgi:hypothetical protein
MIRKLISGGLIAMCISGSAVELPQAAELEKMARTDAMNPIAPGKIGGKAPFWNNYAMRFIYVPSFEFKAFPGVEKYRFTVIDAENKVHTFTAERPDEPLSAVWDDLPVGFTTVSIDALNAEDQVVDNSGVRKFYRASPFRGNYAPPRCDDRESAEMALKYVFEQQHNQSWRKTGKPSRSYQLYCYPNKIIASVIKGMINYAQLSPKDREAALDIACKCADYLISISEKPGTPLEYMPPTYMWQERASKAYLGQIMMIYPCVAGEAYMLLYDTVKDEKYLKAAERIADTYCKTQLDNGSWYLKIYMKDGTPVMPTDNALNAEEREPNYCVPVEIADFLNHIGKVCKNDRYLNAANRAVNYIRKNVQPAFNWEGQFEDQIPRAPYVNNTKHTAVRYAQYLLKQDKCSKADVEYARILLRYAEDQFVVWERPMPRFPIFRSHSTQWLLPCVLEQYAYYVPIDASAATLLNFYVAMHKKSGNPLDLAKAKALADAITRGQDPETGRYMTYWETNERGKLAGWINCAMVSAYAVMNFNDYLDSLNKK